jgi:hypothetical protein
MKLYQYLATHFPARAARYKALSPANRVIADRVLGMRLAACGRLGVSLDDCAVREIIEDSEQGRDVAADIEPGDAQPEDFGRSSTLAGGSLRGYQHYAR